MTKVKIGKFTTSATNTPEELKKAVIHQMGVSHFIESAQDIVDYGAAGGFAGFILYSDTTLFYSQNRKSILNLARQQADEYGYSTIADMVAAFNCIDLKPHQVEYAITLDEESDDFTHVANGIAWYVLEEVARDFIQWLEG